MDKKHSNAEKGQAIVYLVLGLVVFLGFVALAIDGGMVLSDRRHAQNAADAASLSGGAAAALHLKRNLNYVCNQQWTCENNSVVTNAESLAKQDAKDRADANSFTIDFNIDDHNGVDVGCGGTNWETGYMTVTVEISTTTPSSFLQLLSTDALQNEVEAVTWVDPGGPLMFGNAIVALNSSDCTGQLGVSFHGTGDVNITGGGVFSNGCLRSDGGAIVNGDPNWPIAGNDASKCDPTDDIDPPCTEVTYQIPEYAYDINPPECPTNPDAWYTDNTLPTDLSGLYCVTGDLTFKKGPYNGTDVTIFVKDGKLTINGNEVVKLNAPTSTYEGDAIPGILFFLPPSNHNTVTLNGTSNVELTGVVFAPGSLIKLTGTNDVTSFKSSQFIGWDVEVGGTQQTNIVYDGCDGFLSPPSINLSK